MLPNVPRAIDFWQGPGPQLCPRLEAAYLAFHTQVPARPWSPGSSCQLNVVVTTYYCMRHASDPELYLWPNLPVLRSSPDQCPCKCTPHR